ncbi:hypothetical protein N806_04385 [Rhodococcus sp. P27]|nr:hypothetical protein N806_04385 [Rhodococcus sp. P27]
MTAIRSGVSSQMIDWWAKGFTDTRILGTSGIAYDHSEIPVRPRARAAAGFSCGATGVE